MVYTQIFFSAVKAQQKIHTSQRIREDVEEGQISRHDTDDGPRESQTKLGINMSISYITEVLTIANTQGNTHERGVARFQMLS